MAQDINTAATTAPANDSPPTTAPANETAPAKSPNVIVTQATVPHSKKNAVSRAATKIGKLRSTKTQKGPVQESLPPKYGSDDVALSTGNGAANIAGPTLSGVSPRLLLRKKNAVEKRTQLDEHSTTNGWFSPIHRWLDYWSQVTTTQHGSVETLSLEKQRCMNIPMSELLAVLKTSARKLLPKPEDFEIFSWALNSISLYYYIRLQESAQQLLEDYAYFDAATSDTLLDAAQWPSKTIDAKENMMLQMIVAALKKADYSMLSEEEYQLATSQSYRLSIDVELDRDQLDTDLFTTFYNTPANDSPERADLCDYVMVFNRGTGLDKEENVFTVDKINIMLRRIGRSVKQLLARTKQADPNASASLVPEKKGNETDTQSEQPIITESSQPSLKDKARNLLSTTTGMVCCALLVVGLIHELLNRFHVGWLVELSVVGCELLLLRVAYTEFFSQSLVRPVDPIMKERWGEKERRRASMPKKEKVNTVTVERLRLETQPLTLRDLLRKTAIQEPTFKDTVIVFRPKGSRHIRLRHFHDIPMADLEILYPYKLPALNPLDLFILAATVIGGVVSLLVSQNFDSGQSNKVLIALSFGFLALAAQSYKALQNKKAAYNKFLTTTLYHKQLGNNGVTLRQVIHDCEEQEVNETCLAFFMMVTAEGAANGITASRLDGLVEGWIKDKFGQEIDFDVRDALIKLHSLGLAKEEGGLYMLTPLREAKATITNEWAALDIGAKKTGKAFKK